MSVGGPTRLSDSGAVPALRSRDGDGRNAARPEPTIAAFLAICAAGAKIALGMTMTGTTMKRLAHSLLLACALIAASCGDDPASDTCTTGSCNQDCSGGSCNLECQQGADCDATCEGGDCDYVCDGESDCNITCLGGGCSVTCSGMADCTVTCTGGACDFSCTESASCNGSCPTEDCTGNGF